MPLPPKRITATIHVKATRFRVPVEINTGWTPWSEFGFEFRPEFHNPKRVRGFQIEFAPEFA